MALIPVCCLHNRPNFVLPLGKGAGKSATMLLQCQLPHVLFTGLEDYKQYVLAFLFIS